MNLIYSCFEKGCRNKRLNVHATIPKGILGIVACRTFALFSPQPLSKQLFGLVRHQSIVAQWLEHPTGVRKVIGSIPVEDLDSFFVPRS